MTEYSTDEKMDFALTDCLDLLQSDLPDCVIAVIAHHGGPDPTTMVLCSSLLPDLNIKLMRAALETVTKKMPEIHKIR